MRSKKRAPSAYRFKEIVAEIVHLLVSERGTDKFVTEVTEDIEDESVTEDKFITEDKSATVVVVRPTDQADKFAGTELLVHSSIQFLKELAQGKPLWGIEKSNTAALSALAKNVRNLRETLNGLPAELLILLAVERLSEQVPSSLGQQNARVRLEKIIAMMNYLQTRCDDLLTWQPGEHANTDFSQRLVAEQAWRLMKYHNRKPASGVYDSAYGEISRLLFEVVTGEKDKNLQRACKSALIRAKKGELTEWTGDPFFKGRLPA